MDYITEEEGRAMFDRAARRHTGMSGDEWLAAWRAGDIDVNGDDHDRQIAVYILLPLVGGA